MLYKQKLSIHLASLSLVNSWIVKIKSMLGVDWRETSTHIFWVITVIWHFCHEQLVPGLHSTRFLCTTCDHMGCRKPLTNTWLCLVYLDNLISFNENATSQTTLIARFTLLFYCFSANSILLGHCMVNPGLSFGWCSFRYYRCTLDSGLYLTETSAESRGTLLFFNVMLEKLSIVTTIESACWAQG